MVSCRYVVLHVLDKKLVGDTEAMGQVYIELGNLDIHRGYSGSFPLADLVSKNLKESFPDLCGCNFCVI